MALVKRRPLIVFFVLAYALTWPLILSVSISPLWGYPARSVPSARRSSWPQSRMAGLA
jgi:hypothetical protein